MKRDAIDLGTINVFTLFKKYFIPTLMGMLSMSAVTAVDGIYVGHGIGSDGIAAINICIPLLMLFTGVGLMMGVGSSVVASIQLSKGKTKAARIHVTQALLSVTLIALVPSTLMYIWPSDTARLLGASPSLTPLVREYLLWFIPSLLFQMWCSICLFVIRLNGNPRLAMQCNVAAALISVILGWLFIFPLKWGLMGAALAATIGLLAGSIIGIAYLSGFATRLRLYRLKWSMKSLRLSLRNISYQCRIGSSALLTEATLAMLMFMGNHVFMKYLGDDGVGAFGIACYYIPFVFMVGNAIAQSAQPIISYNFGLGYRTRVSATERIALYTAVVCGIMVTMIFAYFPHLLVGLFIRPDSPAARLAIEGYPYFAAAFVFFIINLTVIGYYQSIERVKSATLIALLRGFILLIPSFLFLPKAMGIHGIWLALCLSELLTTVIIALNYGIERIRITNHRNS